jgi:CRP-like cAMP-binding protein
MKKNRYFSSNIKPNRKFTHKRAFDAQAFLDSAGMARKVVEYRRSEKIYSQGDPATNVMYIQEGDVKLSVVNQGRKEAVVAILGPNDFFGEGYGKSALFNKENILRPSLPTRLPE